MSAVFPECPIIRRPVVLWALMLFLVGVLGFVRFPVVAAEVGTPQPPAVEVSPETRPEADTSPGKFMPERPYTLQNVLDAKLMSPYPDGQFHPERLISRAQLAVILVNTFQLGSRRPLAEEIIALTDVPPDHWGYDAIQTAVRKGLMTGYREGRFYPDQKVTRAEGFAIFAQAFGVYSFKEDMVDEILAPYADSGRIPVWARKSLATAISEGFVNTPDDPPALRPQAPMTRGDMAFALARWLSIQNRYSPAKGL